ncbi:hypothetical protein J4E81_002086 [Alternaria sp. BMP 2799]|nr:hypothetical protein J4E81_002086 [Alternaria sp. BMP 2799]
MIMLHYAADCVTETDLTIVVEAYPAVGNVFRSCFRAIQRGHDFSQVSRLIQMPRDVFTASFCDAVQYTLDLAAKHPEFEELISKACELPQHYPWSQPPFIQGSHLQVLGWRPMPWLIPTHADLCGMEDLLTVVQGPTRERAKTYEGINHYFSATAICIAALSRLTPTSRKHLRNIILQEDCRSLGNPEVHAEGLIGYCTENRKLHFLMQASFSTMLAPSFWSIPDALLTYPDRGTSTRVHSYIRILVDWLMRTAALTKLGMPKTSYAVVLDAQSPQAVYLWHYISQAAPVRAHIPEELLKYETAVDNSIPVLHTMYQWLWRLPAGLSSVVEDINNDVSTVRLKIPDSESLPQREPAKPYATWSFMDWCLAYTPGTDEVEFPGDADAYFQKVFKERI